MQKKAVSSIYQVKQTGRNQSQLYNKVHRHDTLAPTSLDEKIIRCVASGEGNVHRTVAQNLTYDKEVAERQMQENLTLTAQNEWERTLKALQDMIVIVDRNHRITFVNQSMQEKLERLPAEMIGQVYPMCKDVFPCFHQELMADRKSRTVEMYNRDLDTNYSINIIPNYSAAGDMIGSVCVLHDIIEVKKRNLAGIVHLLRHCDQKT